MTEQQFSSLLYLWDKRTLYIGPLFEPLDLSQGAATLLVSLDKPVSFHIEGKGEGEGESIYCTSLLLPAGMSVTVNTYDAIVANCNLDPLGADFSGLASLMQKKNGKIFYDLKQYVDFKQVYQNFYTQQIEVEKANELLKDLLENKFSQFYPKHMIDNRVEKLVAEIKKTSEENISVEDLSRLVNLSVPRLVQLFKKQTGVPIRRYRLWHRLFVTAKQMAMGGNLTEAAMDAGFADSAHFSHTFKSMFGMTLTAILLQPNGLNIMFQDQ
jgi:AraC-like DNA-binding protein